MFRVITPELNLDQRATLLGFHGTNARVMIEPLDAPSDGLDEVTTEMDVKTPCQRQRAVLFLIWKRAGSVGAFETYYITRMEKNIEKLKGELD